MCFEFEIFWFKLLFMEEVYLKHKKKKMEGLMSSVSTVKPMIVVILMWTILFRCVSAAVNHTVGGSSGWDLSSNLSLWSTSTSFSVNDSLGNSLPLPLLLIEFANTHTLLFCPFLFHVN